MGAQIGCHDNGYVTNLRSHITAGFKQKLILLRSFTEMAAGIIDLELPVLTIPELFLEKKLVVPTHPSQAAAAKSSRTGSVECPTSIFTELGFSEHNQGSGATPEHTMETESPAPPRRFFTPSSYSSAVQVTQKRVPTPDLDSSGSTTSEVSDDLPEPSIPTFKGSRHVNPNIALSKHKPPPCTLFYLANCKHGADCKYGHDYLLEAEHFNEIRLNAKKAPCPAINKGRVPPVSP
ncbi:hypothetical protein C0995_013138 [Termitomyces sp. Mi166|nr:hypothetical protein C0995_013138 [Termitomyces sp. Mi166\